VTETPGATAGFLEFTGQARRRIENIRLTDLVEQLEKSAPIRHAIVISREGTPASL